MDSFNIEQGILGSIISDFKQFEHYKGLITLEDFSNPLHAKIFTHISKLVDEGYLDILCLIDSLKAEGTLEDIGGISYLTSLSTWSIGNLDYHIQLLKEKSDKRKIIQNAQKLIEDISSGTDVIESLDKFKSNTEVKVTDNMDCTLGAIMEEIFIELQGDPVPKLKTGVGIVDQVTGGGLIAPNLVTIGALSSVGKTTMALEVANNASMQDKKILIVSREMSAKKLAMKYLISATGISKKRFDNKELSSQDWFYINKAMEKYNKVNFRINDKISTIAQIKKEVIKFKPDLLIVDYLQLLSSSNNNNESREREIAGFSRALKNMSQDYNMVVIQLSQLRDRQVDTAPIGETCMRESRAVYQDSDTVIYIHRVTNEKELQAAHRKTDFKKSSYDHMLSMIEDAEENQFLKFVYVNVDKNRDGETGGQYYWFNAPKMTYNEIKLEKVEVQEEEEKKTTKKKNKKQEKFNEVEPIEVFN